MPPSEVQANQESHHASADSGGYNGSRPLGSLELLLDQVQAGLEAHVGGAGVPEVEPHPVRPVLGAIQGQVFTEALVAVEVGRGLGLHTQASGVKCEVGHKCFETGSAKYAGAGFHLLQRDA
jgi:hypothetical protein